jgi:hypothetical protein
MWQRGNAVVNLAFRSLVLLDANSVCGHVDMRVACDVGHTMCPKEHGGRDMHYFSNVVDDRPMLLVAGQILLAFSCAAPLVLLLCFLI